MKRLFSFLLVVVLSLTSVWAQSSEAPWSYTVSMPDGGTRVTTEENGTEVTQNYASTKLYTLSAATDGVRFTVVETNKAYGHVNGFCYFVLGEFTVLDANGTPVEYTVTSNSDFNEHNEYNSRDGEGLSALNDGVLNNFFHSNYSNNAPSAYHYIELTFKKPLKSFSLEWYGRPNNSAYEFSPTLCGITPKGYEFTEDMLYGNNEEDDEINDSVYKAVDVFKEPCLFVSLTNGGVDAYPLSTLAKEQYKKNDTLCVPLNSGNIIKYHASEYTGISNQVPQLPYLISYKFNNKYNANLNVDVIADCSSENVEVSLNSIGKWLTASFQLSEERGIAYIGNKLQTSKKTRNSFAESVQYTATYPGYNVIMDVMAQDSTYKNIKIPFGRLYTVTPKWLTDGSQAPRIDIDMAYPASSITKETYLDAKITISGFGVYNDFSDSVQIKGRGNSTWGYAKKPYRLKFASKVKPFGLTKGKSWVLLANAQHGALMANAIAMKIGQLVNAPCANHIIPIELYMNGEYMGSYMFTEQVGLSGNSVDVDEDLGYLLELDSYFDEDFKFKSGIYDLPVNVKDPDLFDYDEAERETKFSAIQADFAKFEEALYNNGPLGQYLDLDAAARFLFVNELVLNKELCHPKSTYLWKGDMYSPDSKIVFGPLWDFDWAFGYENTGRYFEIGYTTSLLSMGTIGRNFFEALMDNEEFRRHYYKVWKEFVDNGYIEEIMEYISDYYSFAESSFKNNNDRWGDGNDYGSKIKTMQNWLKKRHDYIFANIKEYDIKDILHTLVGDIDCNDLLTIQDVALFADYLLGKADEKFNIAKADIDADGKIGYSDFVRSAVLLACGESLPPMYFFEKPVSSTALISVGKTVTSDNAINIPIHLQNNKEGIKAIQADIVVPSNVVIENIFTGNRANGDSIVYTQITDELYRVVAYNKNGIPFVCDKPILNLEVSVTGFSASEQPVVKVKDILVVDSVNLEKRADDAMFAVNNSGGYSVIYVVDGEIYKIVTLEEGDSITPIEEPSKRGYIFSGWKNLPAIMPAEDIVVEGTFTLTELIGDANKDGVVSIGDVVAVINYILKKQVTVFDFDAADVTGDNLISIADVVGIINIILDPDSEKTAGYNAKHAAIINGEHLTMNDVRSDDGSVSIPVKLADCDAYTAFQMDVELPDGATFTSATLNADAAGSHALAWRYVDDRNVRLVAYSLSNVNFTDSADGLVTFNVEASEDLNDMVTVGNVRMVTADGIVNAIGGCGSTIEIGGTTGTDIINADAIVRVNGNSITLTNADNCSVVIYSAAGSVVERIDNYSGEEIALDGGIYIIRAGNRVVKIKL